MTTDKTTPQPCSMCGKPSTVYCLADPFGKSDRFEWRCADHNPWLSADAVIVQQQPMSQTTRPKLTDLLDQIVYDGGPMVCARAAGRLNILTARLKQLVAAVDAGLPGRYQMRGSTIYQAMSDARRCLEDGE